MEERSGMLVLIIKMQAADRMSLEQIRAFLESSKMEFRAEPRGDVRLGEPNAPATPLPRLESARTRLGAAVRGEDDGAGPSADGATRRRPKTRHTDCDSTPLDCVQR